MQVLHVPYKTVTRVALRLGSKHTNQSISHHLVAPSGAYFQQSYVGLLMSGQGSAYSAIWTKLCETNDK